MQDPVSGHAGKKHGRRGLRRRWITGSLIPVLLVLAALVAVGSLGVSSYYYNAMRTGLELKAQETGDTINSYFMNSYAEYERFAVSYINGFEDGERLELQILSSSGRIRTVPASTKANRLQTSSSAAIRITTRRSRRLR